MRCAVIKLHNLFAGDFADILNRNNGNNFAFALTAKSAAHLKVRIRKTKAERVANFFRRSRNCFKIAIADINIVLIVKVLITRLEHLSVLITVV